MRSSQKSGRGRGKNNRNKGQAHSPNRVYESAGPEGKVRGTPQQIIDKYQALARDAQLSGDRVAAENFLQHAEHYARILVAAQEANERREAQHQQNQQNHQNNQNNQNQPHDPHGQGGAERKQRSDSPVAVIGGGDEQPPSDGLAALDAAQGGAPEIVDTPEAKAPRAPARPRRPRPRRDAPEEATADSAPEAAEPAGSTEPDAAAG